MMFIHPLFLGKIGLTEILVILLMIRPLQKQVLTW